MLFELDWICAVGNGGRGLLSMTLSDRGIFEVDPTMDLLGLESVFRESWICAGLKGVPLDGRGGLRDLVLCERGSIEGLSAIVTGIFVLLVRANDDLVGDNRL